MSKKKFNPQVFASLFLFSGCVGAFSFGSSAEAVPSPSKTFYQGQEIDLQTPCTQVTMEVDPALTKGINQKGVLPKNISITVAKDEAQNRILIHANECVPSAHLALQIPANFSVVYHDSPKASLQINGDIASFEGSVTEGDKVVLGQVDSLDLKMTGDSKVSIGKLHRAAQLIAGDNASFTSKDADLSVFSLFGSAQSEVLLRSGHIATAHFTMADEGQAQVFASVGHADVRSKDKGFVRLGTVAQAPEITDGSVIRKETVPAGSIVVSQPDVIVPPPPEDIIALATGTQPVAPTNAVAGQAVSDSVQPVIAGSDEKSAQEDSVTQPAPGVPATATQPVIATPVAPVVPAAKSTLSTAQAVPPVDQKRLKEDIKKEKAEQKAAIKDEKRIDQLATSSVNASSSLMVS